MAFPDSMKREHLIVLERIVVWWNEGRILPPGPTPRTRANVHLRITVAKAINAVLADLELCTAVSRELLSQVDGLREISAQELGKVVRTPALYSSLPREGRQITFALVKSAAARPEEGGPEPIVLGFGSSAIKQ